MGNIVSLQKLVKYDEIENNIEKLYDINKPEQTDYKLLLQVICITLYYERLANVIKYLEYTSLVHTQHYLRKIKDNNNSENDLSSNINLFNVYLHAIIYSKVMLEFTLKTIDL